MEARHLGQAELAVTVMDGTHFKPGAKVGLQLIEDVASLLL